VKGLCYEMNNLLKVSTIKLVLSAHKSMYLTFLVFLVENFKIVLASMKTLTNSKIWTGSRIRICIRLSDSVIG
jgi:hypothetical protein